MNSRDFKNSIYTEFAKIGKVLSSPKRIELLDLLSQSPKSVELLAKETNMSVANTSKHLQALLEASLVTYAKNKNFVIYQLANQKVVDLLFSLKNVTEEQIPKVNLLRDDFIVRADHIETIPLEDWVNGKSADDYLLIDVRPKSEYQSGHLESAISIPIEELPMHINRLPKDKRIIAYCRGSYCVYSTEAVELLQSKGFKAFRLEASVHEWNQYQEKHFH